MPTKGLSATLVDGNTGATASFHSLSLVQFDLRNNTTMVIMASYVGESQFDAKKSPIFSNTFNLPSAPPADQDPREWAYGQLTVAVPSGANAADPKYRFAGASLIAA